MSSPAIGPIAAGAMLDSTGSFPAVLLFLAMTGIVLAIAGYRAALPRYGRRRDHRLSPLPGTALTRRAADENHGKMPS